MRRILFALSLILFVFTVRGNDGGLIIQGNIKTITPISISLKSLSGKVIFETTINKANGNFKLGPVNIMPDLYLLSIGKTREYVYCLNNTISIKGYYNDIDNSSSNLEFSGLDEYLKIQSYGPKKLADFDLNPEAFTALKTNELAALAYLFNSDKYEFNNSFLQKIPENARQTESAKWLVKTVDSLKQYITGITAPDFSLPDENNKMVALKDFRDKIVVLDFWASWCVPCRREMQNFKTFYKEFEPNVQFISISMDNDQTKYQQGLREMNIPWVKLWDKTGFSEDTDEKAGFFKSNLRLKYGFKAIPFCVIIDKNGMVLRRGIFNGESLKQALTEITKRS